MKKRKVVLSSLATAMVMSVLVACSSGKEAPASSTAPATPGKKEEPVTNLNATGFPIVKYPIKLTFFASKSNSNLGNWNETTVWKEYKKMTNIDVDFQLVPVDALTEKRNLALVGGNLPDAFHTARLSSVDLANYGSQGIFIKLNDLIDKYAPNLKKILDKYPEVKKGLTMPDGSIYSFPTLLDPEHTSSIIGSQLWVNQSFLDALGMKMPETTGDYYNYLKAVKTQDPNKNGKADEIPFLASGITMLYDHLKGAWGLGTRGNTHPRVDVDPATNKLRYIPADPKYKEVLQYLNKLNAEGLFYKDIFTVTLNDVTAAYTPGVVGSSLYTNPNLTYPNITGMKGVPTLKGPNGDKLFSRARSFMVLTGGMAITKANKYPAETVRWVDYFYSDEGSKLFRLGVKDVSYTEKDGKFDYVDALKKDSSQLGKHVTWAGGWYPGMDNPKYIISSESDPENMRVSELIKPTFPKELWPEFTYSATEMSEFKALETDLGTYVDEMMAKFVKGTVPFSEWDNYAATLKKMGLDRYLKIYEAAYERYKKG
ncbi:ABC transporter substrate-binding protein [Paenibacillus sp. HJGM_3]|uniref:ABC transporter substrate-binding protein n=1 Tax=Paenibacillus sp. HJGM_3 TaxID=3379816 RepID=UPI00385ECD02